MKSQTINQAPSLSTYQGVIDFLDFLDFRDFHEGAGDLTPEEKVHYVAAISHQLAEPDLEKQRLASPLIPSAVAALLVKRTQEQLDRNETVEHNRRANIAKVVGAQVNKYLSQVNHTHDTLVDTELLQETMLVEAADQGDWLTVAILIDGWVFPEASSRFDVINSLTDDLPEKEMRKLWRVAAAFNLRQYSDIPPLLAKFADSSKKLVHLLDDLSKLATSPVTIAEEEFETFFETHAPGTFSYGWLVSLVEAQTAMIEGSESFIPVCLSEYLEHDQVAEGLIYSIIKTIPKLDSSYLAMLFQEMNAESDDDDDVDLNDPFGIGNIMVKVEEIGHRVSSNKSQTALGQSRVPPTVWKPSTKR